MLISAWSKAWKDTRGEGRMGEKIALNSHKWESAGLQIEAKISPMRSKCSSIGLCPHISKRRTQGFQSRVKALAYKPDDLSTFPGTHMMERGNWPPKVVF